MKTETARSVFWVALLLLLLVGLGVSGCSVRIAPERIPSQYVARDTENGIWIFEYKPGTHVVDDDANSLIMFMDCLNQWNKDHPELELRRLESLHTQIRCRQDGCVRTISVVNILAYTKPKEKS